MITIYASLLRLTLRQTGASLQYIGPVFKNETEYFTITLHTHSIHPSCLRGKILFCFASYHLSQNFDVAWFLREPVLNDLSNDTCRWWLLKNAWNLSHDQISYISYYFRFHNQKVKHLFMSPCHFKEKTESVNHKLFSFASHLQRKTYSLLCNKLCSSCQWFRILIWRAGPFDCRKKNYLEI